LERPATPEKPRGAFNIEVDQVDLLYLLACSMAAGKVDYKRVGEITLDGFLSASIDTELLGDKPTRKGAAEPFSLTTSFRAKSRRKVSSDQ